MCWNAEVSLNTFLFSSGVLGLIAYNNAYTKYKIPEFSNVWVYVFFMSFILMQLIEFFIWRNVKNSYYNSIFTFMALILLFFQPMASIMVMNNSRIKKILILSYLILMSPKIYKSFTNPFPLSTTTKMRHLNWNLAEIPSDNITVFIWYSFFLLPFLFSKHYSAFLFGTLTLILIIYQYRNDKSISSNWCYIVNSIMVYYAIYLLIILPQNLL